MKFIRTIMLLTAMFVPVLGMGQDWARDYEAVAIKDLAGYEGRLVSVTGELVSVDAGLKRLDIFDNTGKALVVVNIDRLPMAQRQTLATDPVRRVTVYGRVAGPGRLTIRADRVVVAAPNLAE